MPRHRLHPWQPLPYGARVLTLYATTRCRGEPLVSASGQRIAIELMRAKVELANGGLELRLVAVVA